MKTNRKQIHIKTCVTPSKDDHKMGCILEALQVQIYKSKMQAKANKIFFQENLNCK